MRTLNQLYLILWEEIKDRERIYGLCPIINNMLNHKIITYEEHDLLINHFKSQKPNKKLHVEFTKSSTWSGSLWWWLVSEDNNPVNRKLFIQKMIKITENE